MSNDDSLKVTRRLTRRNAQFRLLRSALKVIWIASSLAAFAIVPVVLLTPTANEWHETVTIVGAFSPVFAFATIGSFILSRKLAEKLKLPIDSRFDQNTYNFLTQYLRAAGVLDPVAYIALKKDHIDAFERMMEVVFFEIDLPSDYRGSKDELEREREERKVAALVLPGEKELALETQLTRLIKERGISSLKEIKEVLDHTSTQPSVLRDGDL